ncbi:MAG: serine hydrolase [Bacteroidota bacterium]
MKSTKDRYIVVLFPLLVGALVASLSLGGKKTADDPFVLSYPDFEFTHWADTLEDIGFKGIPVVHISGREAAKASAVLLQNRLDLLPFDRLKNRRFHMLTLGTPLPALEKMVNNYTSVSTEAHQDLSQVKWKEYRIYETIIIALNELSPEKQAVVQALVDKLVGFAEVAIVNFGDHQVLSGVAEHATVLHCPSNQRKAQEVVGQMLFGGLPVMAHISDEVKEDLSLSQRYTTHVTRLGYTDPEYLGFESDSLVEIDAIIAEGIREFAFPGAQVLIAKEGKVIFHKAYGYHTYERQRPVETNDLYDLASITKVASTTLAAMKLYEEKKLRLDAPLKSYFNDPTYTPSPYRVYDTIPKKAYYAYLDTLAADSALAFAQKRDTISFQDSLFLVGSWVYPDGEKHLSPVFNIRIKDLLTHTSGLQPSLPIVPYKRRYGDLYSQVANQSYTVPVAHGMFMRENYLDSLWNMTKALQRDSGRYQYSCVNMILLQRAIDSINQTSIGNFVSDNFYQELGLQTLCYNPLDYFSANQVVPTATDRWRNRMLCGTVHDPTAALMGGVSGNAGLFSNASDLAILGQMLLNGGSYGGVRYLRDSTVKLFTQRQRGHRGYGFDKPPKTTQYVVGESATLKTYGHTGFTGTCFWVDPENELVYIFLSNRIHPSVNNNRINELRLRQRVHQVIYDAMEAPLRAPIRRDRPAEPTLSPDEVIVQGSEQENEEITEAQATTAAPTE